MKSGIYAIINKKNNKIYIGQSIDVVKRIKVHKYKLLNNKHPNTYLQNEFNKYKDFEYKIVEYCSDDKLDIREQYWIAKFDAMNRAKGYNRESGGNLGRVYSKERKEALKGEGNPMFGKHHSEEFIAKMKTINRGSSDKLSIEDVSEIKKSYLSGEKQKNLALKYNVKISTINKIIRCKNWEWVESELNDKLIVYENNLKKQRNELILNMFSDGKTLADISKVTGCDYYTIKKIIGEDKIESLKKERKNNKNEKRKNIIKDYKNGLTKEDIMKKYNISSTTYVRCISDTYNENKNRAISEVKKLKKQGLTNVEIADILKIHRTTVTEYLKK